MYDAQSHSSHNLWEDLWEGLHNYAFFRTLFLLAFFILKSKNSVFRKIKNSAIPLFISVCEECTKKVPPQAS